jgi:hypothetical protein
MSSHCLPTRPFVLSLGMVLLWGCGDAIEWSSSSNLALQTETEKVDSLITARAPGATAEVYATTDGRKITIRFPSAPDSLVQMEVTNQPDTAKVIATDLTKRIMASYSNFDQVHAIEVEFAQESQTFLPSTSLILDQEDFRRLRPEDQDA